MALNRKDKPSAETLARVKALDKRKIDVSDIPEANQDQLKQIAKIVREKRKKRMFSLRLANDTISWWQEFGDGYTGIMARLLDEARSHPEWVKLCM
jgi:uncharacterized protein (DUF4415 family)